MGDFASVYICFGYDSGVLTQGHIYNMQDTNRVLLLLV